MMYVRNKAMPWIGVSLALCAMVACSVTVTQEPDGITGTITIANQKIAFSLNVLDPFQITANAPPVPQAARINLYDGTPKAVPENAQLTLEAADVQAIMLAPLKAVPRSQTLTGSAQVNVSIGAYDGNPCAEGTYIGSFHVTFSGGSVAIDQVNLDIPADVLTTILTGSFSICLQVSADIGVQITIAGMGVQFGPPIDEACALDSDCPAGETCVNGVCVSGAEPECVFNSDCATGETCVNGECVAGTAPECEFDSDCAAGEACVNGECVSDTTPECVFDSDCATGETCVNGECVADVAADLFTLTISVTGDGAVEPPGGAYEAGEVVTLTATPVDGWRFDSWEGNLTGSDNPTTITINEDTTITAVFVQVGTSAITFRATYDRLWDTAEQNPGYGILKSVMSADGNRLVWAIQDNETGALSIVTMNVDGSDQTIIPVPAEADSIWEVTVNYDGSRAFFRRWFNLLFKVEGGVITQILDVADVAGLGSIGSIQTTTTGDYVYCLDDEPNDNDVWRVSHNGGTPELVVDDVDVILHNGFAAAQVADYSVSGDGGSLVFTTHGYWDDGYHSRSEMFIQTGGVCTQLTTDGDDYTKGSPRISGDGSIIIFNRGLGEDSWYSIHPNGTNEIELGAAGYNLGGPVLTHDGSKMLYSDNESGGTVLLNTDGSGRQNIVTAWNISNIAIGATYHHALSDDATRVSFYTQYGILPESAAFYVGYLEDPDIIAPTVADAPFVDSIAFSPGTFPRSSPDATLLLLASISDPDGLTDVTNTAVDAMIDGVHSSYADVPAYFYFSPRDDGESPDEISADGVFTSSASAGEMLDTLGEVTIRVSVMDASKTITVADTVLTIGN